MFDRLKEKLDWLDNGWIDDAWFDDWVEKRVLFAFTIRCKDISK